MHSSAKLSFLQSETYVNDSAYKITVHWNCGPLTRSGSDRTGSDRTHKTWIGSDRTHKTWIGSDRTHKTWIGSDRTHKTWIGSNSIKETHIHSLKVDVFQFPIKDDKERSRKWLPWHCFCFFFCILSWRLFVYCYGFTFCELLHYFNYCIMNILCLYI